MVYPQIFQSICLLSALLLVHLNAKAQQFTDTRHYLFNYQSINPAALGLGNAPELRAGFKRQWAGLEGAPLAFYASAFTNYWGKGAKSDGPNRYHSFGGQALTESAGILRRSGLQVQYAYHLRLSETLRASFGASLGLLTYGIQTDKIVTANPNDPGLRNQATQVRPDANLGLWLTDNRFFLGFSLNQIIEHRVLLSTESRIERQTNLTAGYTVPLDQEAKWSLTPSLLVRYSQTRSMLDFSTMLNYKQHAWTGLSYRSSGLLAVFCGGSIKNKCRVSYFYDLATNAASQISNGSHELLLAFPLGSAKSSFNQNSIIY